MPRVPLSGSRDWRAPPGRDAGELRPAAWRQLLCAVLLSPAWAGRARCGEGGRGVCAEAARRTGRPFCGQELSGRIGARRPGLPGRAGSCSLPGRSGWRPRLADRCKGGRLRPLFFYYYYYFPHQPTKAAGPQLGQGLLSDCGFPEQTLEFVCVSPGAFCSPHSPSGL